MMIAPAFAALLLTAALPRPAPKWSSRQPFPVVVDAGVQALGFKPIPANPNVSVGTELRLVQRRVYGLHVGLALGGFHQPRFARAVYLDATLGQRLTAPFGLYGDLDVVVGGQLSWFPGATYRADGGRPRAVRPPTKGAARLGLGLAIGLDLGRITRVPIRVFARYRQYAWTPFMLGNTLPAMGIATLTGGVAVEIGTWIRNNRR